MQEELLCQVEPEFCVALACLLWRRAGSLPAEAESQVLPDDSHGHMLQVTTQLLQNLPAAKGLITTSAS